MAGHDEPKRGKDRPVYPAISLRIPPDVAREFRVEAARHGKHLNDFFVDVWGFYKEKNNGAV